MPKHEWVLFRGKNGDVMISYPKKNEYGSYIPFPDGGWTDPGIKMSGIRVDGKRRYRSPEAWHAQRVTDPETAEPTFYADASCSYQYEDSCSVLKIKLWP